MRETMLPEALEEYVCAGEVSVEDSPSPKSHSILKTLKFFISG